MKKIISCLIILAICAALMPVAYASPPPRPVTVDYDDLTKMIVAGNAAYQKELQEIQKLEYTYDDLSQQRWDLYMDMDALPHAPETEASRKKLEDAADTVSANMRIIRNRINDQKKALDNRAALHAYPAQRMYMGHFILMIDSQLAAHELERLERELANCRLKLSRGLSTQTEVKNAEKNVDNQKDAIKAVRDAIDDNLTALARYLGLTSQIRLADMPQVDLDRIVGRNLKTDQADYIAAASSTAEKVLQGARDSFELNNTPLNRYNRDIALADFEKAKRDAEADFPKVYENLLNAYEDYMESTLVIDAQEDYDLAEMQFERGLISRNMLLNVEQMLEVTKSRYEQQRIQLCLLFREYEFNLIKP